MVNGFPRDRLARLRLQQLLLMVQRMMASYD